MKLPQAIIKEKIVKNAIDWAKTLKKIEVITNPSDTILFNSACHLNSVNQVKQGKAVAVAEVILIDNNPHPVVHYINLNSQGEYYDITLGWHWSSCDYRLVRIIPADSKDYDNIYTHLMNLKSKLYNKSSKYLRMIHRGDRTIF